MAQIQEFMPQKEAAGRWGGLQPAPDSNLNSDSAAQLGQNANPRAEARGLIALPNLRNAKVSGLRLGERKLIQALADWLVLTGGTLVILSRSERDYAAGAMFVSLALVTVLWFFFSDAFDAYNVVVMQTRFPNAYTVGKVFLATSVTYILLAWFTGGFLPVIRFRISETFLAALLIIPLILTRIIFSMVLSRAPLRRHIVVVGANMAGQAMVEALKQFGGDIYEFLGYFDDNPTLHSLADNLDPTEVLPVSELLYVMRERGIDQIVLANPTQNPALLRVLSICHERGIQVTPMFALYQDLTGRVPVSHLGKDWFVALPANVKSTARTYLVAKRLLDIVLALTVLAVTAPIMLLVALAIKLDSPGPILFNQTRVGRGGKLFKIYKFRSMRPDAEATLGAVWAKHGDPRITSVGRILRKSRLDELPQMWNLLVGDMSFVGPRPERPEFDEKLDREIPFYKARRAVRPGLTGWAQVRHGYGNTMADALRKVEFDLYYIKNESVYLDLMIILRTVAVVLKLGGT